MNGHVRISYENRGNVSYLTAGFPNEEEVIRYRLEMLASNRISHVLATSKRMKDGELLAYYDISSKIALSQVTGRRKLKRQEMRNLIDGLVRAARDAGEYQLPVDGFVFDPDFIFVDPSDCSPCFLYLPVQGEERGAQEFLKSLILQGRIEMTSDNFVQLLLETLNHPLFSVDMLAECILEEESPGGGEWRESRVPGDVAGAYQRAGGAAGAYQGCERAPALYQAPGGTAGEYRESMGAGAAYQTPDMGGMPMPGQPGSRPSSGQNTGGMPMPGLSRQERPIPYRARLAEDGGKGPAAGKRGNGSGQAKAEQEEGAGEFDAAKARKKFLLPQAVIMVALAGLTSFGFFFDADTGKPAVSSVLAALILVGVTEIILYREAYVNGKSREPGREKRKKGGQKPEKERKKGKKGAKRPETAMAGRPSGRPAPPEAGCSRPEMPAADRGWGADDVVLTGRGNEGFGALDPSVYSSLRPPQPAPVPAVVSAGAGRQEHGGETELWDPSEGIAGPFLEYYENGMLTRVPLDGPSTLIGHLRGEVNFEVMNPKVSKIHAEFINDGAHISVKDLNSKNGTYINGSAERIRSNVAYPLSSGDRIRLADSEFVLFMP
ncbi:FHA domain-containing protein [Clostridiaceae bacterium]|nr:FHA domain-containing protein [Clostridiaceae bacterium]